MSAPYYLRSVAGGHHKPGAVNALPDLLDAAVLPELLAAAWDEGHHAGHEEARAGRKLERRWARVSAGIEVAMWEADLSYSAATRVAEAMDRLYYPEAWK